MECVISEIDQLWGSSFFWKCWRFNAHFENARKNWEKAFCFWDNCVRIGCVKLSLLRREYLSSAVNVLTTSYKALRLTKKDFFRLNYLPNDQQIWKECCCPDRNSVSTHFPCCLSKGLLKRDFLDIYLTTFSGVPNFGNKSAMRVILFLKMFKI